MSFNIAVHWILEDRSITLDTCKGRPCIGINFTTQIEQDNSLYDLTKLVPLIAMIDTGADQNVVDATICASAPIIRYVPARGFLSSGLATVRRGTLFFSADDGSAIPCSDEFASVPIVGEPYNAVLGRPFLKMCKFVYDGANSIATLVLDTDRFSSATL